MTATLLKGRRRHIGSFDRHATLTLRVSYSKRSFWLLTIRNTPPLLRSRRKPLRWPRQMITHLSRVSCRLPKPDIRWSAHAHLALRPHTR